MPFVTVSQRASGIHSRHEPFPDWRRTLARRWTARHLAMMDELVSAVARGAGLTPDQAALAVAAALRFFTARLPSSLVGELHARLGTRQASPPPDDQD